MNIINYGENNGLIKRVLEYSRKRYGEFNQIMVSVEELCELASIISKIPRYNTIEEALHDIKDDIIDEVSDVIIILDHIISIAKIDDRDIEIRINKKIDRLKRWIQSDGDMSITTRDRGI